MENKEKASYRWPMLGYLSFVSLVFNGIAVNVMPPLFPPHLPGIESKLCANRDESWGHSIEEERQLTFGQSLQRRLIVVSHTKRGDRTRIINARLMDRNERVIYEEG